MNNDVKEILDVSDIMELLETTSKKEFYRLTIDNELVVRLYNYIINLKEENRQTKLLKEKYQLEKETYKSRINKALEYIHDYTLSDDTGFDSQASSELTKILEGSEK